MDQPGMPPPENPTPPTPPVSLGSDSGTHDIEQNKDVAAFSYLWIMSVFVYFLRRHSPFVRYHAKQAIVLFVLSIIVWFIPLINRLLELGVLCMMAYGFFHAAQGHRKDVPIVGPLSRREITIRDAWKQLLRGIVTVVQKIKALWKHHTSTTPKPPSPPSSPPAPPSTPPTP